MFLWDMYLHKNMHVFKNWRLLEHLLSQPYLSGTLCNVFYALSTDLTVRSHMWLIWWQRKVIFYQVEPLQPSVYTASKKFWIPEKNVSIDEMVDMMYRCSIKSVRVRNKSICCVYKICAVWNFGYTFFSMPHFWNENKKRLRWRQAHSFSCICSGGAVEWWVATGAIRASHKYRIYHIHEKFDLFH